MLNNSATKRRSLPALLIVPGMHDGDEAGKRPINNGEIEIHPGLDKLCAHDADRLVILEPRLDLRGLLARM